MDIKDIKAKAFDTIVSAYYNEKLNKGVIDALIMFTSQFEAVKATTVTCSTPETESKPAKEEKKAEKKEATTKREAKVDKGKIKACYEAGWSITKIADEMGLTSPTIQYHLKQMGLK